MTHKSYFMSDIIAHKNELVRCMKNLIGISVCELLGYIKRMANE